MTRLRTEDLWIPLRRRLSRIRRSNREFDAFLRTLDYVPSRPEAPTGPGDFVICGSPRSGTTLAAAQLFQPPAVVTVMEPWEGLRVAPHALFESVRVDLQDGVLRHGKLDVEALRSGGRVAWRDEGTPVDVGPVDTDVIVGVKWPSWWQYLDRLPDTRFIVCLRHPYEVIDSYQRTGGRLREGSDHPVAMNRTVNQEARAAGHRLALRRARLYETINRRLLDHLDRPNVYALRYERWHQEPERLREELAAFLGIPLGPWPARIQPSAHRTAGPELVDLVRSHVPVARDLGYDHGPQAP